MCDQFFAGLLKSPWSNHKDDEKIAKFEVNEDILQQIKRTNNIEIYFIW